MSKAFKKEDLPDDDVPDPERDRLAERKSYISPAGYRKLQQEIDRLWRVERPQVTQEVAAAAAQGDRSENAEYIYGKRRLREIDRRLRYLAKRLDHLTVVTPPVESNGRVVFGTQVTVVDEDEKEHTYCIVGPDETDVGAGRISVESPMAKALLGKQEGDTVTVVRPRGSCELTVVRVRV